jgi:hypothetical protein
VQHKLNKERKKEKGCTKERNASKRLVYQHADDARALVVGDVVKEAVYPALVCNLEFERMCVVQGIQLERGARVSAEEVHP